MALRVEDVRFYIEDRRPTDNELAGDLMFTDKEIADAMYRAGREFNSIHPQSICVDPSALPDSDNLFLSAASEYLYRARLHSLMRNQFDYQGGSIQTSGRKPQIDGLKELVRMEADTWRPQAQQRKIAANIRTFYGTLG
jgi:hypothetical protein